MLKAKEIIKLSVEDLNARKKELSMELFKIKLQKNMGTTQNKKAIKNMRHDIARINTVLSDKVRAGGTK